MPNYRITTKLKRSSASTYQPAYWVDKSSKLLRSNDNRNHFRTLKAYNTEKPSVLISFQFMGADGTKITGSTTITSPDGTKKVTEFKQENGDPLVIGESGVLFHEKKIKL